MGTAEQIAQSLIGLSEAGVTGVSLSFVDFISGIERFVTDVVPLLEKAGVREPVAALSTAS